MPAANRNEIPDYGVRLRRLADLALVPALPLGDVAMLLDLPASSLDKIRAEGGGPHVFRIGRRLYVRRGDLLAWLDELAEAEREHPSSRPGPPKRGRKPAAAAA